MSDENVTNPEPVEELDQEGVAETEYDSVEVADLSDETHEEADETESEEPEVELIDYEFNGKKLKIPADIKDNLMMQADYTRKTQEVAEQRKALEAQIQQHQQFNQEMIQDAAKLHAIDERLQQFNELDWNGLIQQDAATAQRLQIELNQLKDAKQQLTQDLGAKQQQRQLEAQQLYAKQIQEGQKVLAEKIPNWGPETAAQLVKHAEQYGYSAQEASQIADPRAVQLLHDAMMYQQLKKQTTKPKEEQAKPNAKVKTKAPASKDPSKMGMDQYFKERMRKRYGANI